MLRTLVISIVFVLVASCATGEPPLSDLEDDGGVRTEDNSAQPPRTDMGPMATGDDAGPSEDVQSECPPASCSVGDTRCEGLGVLTCIADPADPDCGTWGDFIECAGDETCTDGQCMAVTECVDADGDGYGPGCEAGTDCADDDPERNPEAAEVCDGVDNNCDGTEDEGFDVGTMCSVGSGDCQGDGVYVCAPDGTAVCDAMATGDPEVCDGVDNDCNGLVDDGDVCAFCTSDPYEPNNSSAEAEPLDPGAPKFAFLCPGDRDFFQLNVQANTDYRLYVTFPEEDSPVTVEYYVDGQVTAPGDSGGDVEIIAFNGNDGTDFEIEVINEGGAEQFFRIVLVDTIPCLNEDAFTPNQTSTDAAFFPADWVTRAYMCAGGPGNGLSDWYFMGTVPADYNITVVTDELDFGMDLDLFLYEDSNGDGSFDPVESRTTFSNMEVLNYSVTTESTYIFEVRDYDTGGGAYEMGWTATPP